MTEGSYAGVKERALVLGKMAEGSYAKIKDRTFIGILSKGQGLYDSFTFENEGATVFRNVGNN
jgi:hypothetical protein